VVIARVVAVAAAGIGWWLLFRREQRPSVWLCTGLRFVREGANALLPLAQIGGDFIGARCLALRGVRGTLAAASVIVDVLMQAISQLAFAIIGLVLLMAMGGNELIVWPLAVGIALALPALCGFLLVQGEFGQRLVNRLLALFAGGRDWLVFGAVNDLFERLGEFYSHRGRLIRSATWHLAGWFVGAIEVWVVLKFMGYPIDFGDAVIIESLLHAVRGAAFAVPGALGAQEGGLIVLCAIFGVPPEAALALSLVKRIPDLVIGVPGLVAWQAMEGWHFHSAPRSAADNQNERA
jgi:putative membrane protein